MASVLYFITTLKRFFTVCVQGSSKESQLYKMLNNLCADIVGTMTDQPFASITQLGAILSNAIIHHDIDTNRTGLARVS